MARHSGYAPGEEDLAYIERLHGPPPAVLAELEAHGRRDGIPIVDREAGRLLAVLATERRSILEIGTAYGHSTLWMALSMAPDGSLTTIDPDEGRTDVARGYWRRAGIPDERITVINRPALEVLADPAALPEPLDLVFIDAIKEEYVAYLDGVLPRCVPGCLILADNVLWSGHVAGAPHPASSKRTTTSTEGLRAFNEHAVEHPRLAATIVPVGDGLLVAVVRP